MEYCLGSEQLNIRKGHCTVIYEEMPVLLIVREWQPRRPEKKIKYSSQEPIIAMAGSVLTCVNM